MKQRMYILVPYNLSPIQKGIQALHAVVEYQILYGNTPEYKQWSEQDKTVIVLNGGTSNSKILSDGSHQGSLDNCYKELIDAEIPVASFYEEDINNALTGVALLAEERVFDKTAYPDYMRLDSVEGTYNNYEAWVDSIGGDKNAFLRRFLGSKSLAN